MRASEWIQAGFATLIALAAWMAPISFERRRNISVLALFAVAFVGLGRASAFVLPANASSILRDWLPVAITLIPYWQTGQFFTGPNPNIQAWLDGTDRWFFAALKRTGLHIGGNTRLSLEWAYALCYPIVPLGLVVLYVAGLRQYADTYWFLVLVPTYICYAITPFFPALPPRSAGASSTAASKTKSRTFNLWILKHGSIQAISFPSAHVASALGVSLALLRYVPAAGAVFLIISIWIGVAAVAEGYHFTIDGVLGALLSLAVFAAWSIYLMPSNLFTAPAAIFVAPL
jgi:PAP2 superfamily